jgi:hypothetical protein
MSKVRAKRQKNSRKTDQKERSIELNRRRTVGSIAFGNLLVSYEKLDSSFLALKHLIAAVIAFGKTNTRAHIIYR